jgi:transcriptional regulator with XRE-family HTH domain
MKQAHLAELAGVTQATVSRWESGAHRPDPDLAARVLDALGARADGALDRAIRRLVEGSALPVHLVCDETHRLLAASRPRARLWAAAPEAMRGASLWPFATPEIREAERRLDAIGWFGAAPPAALVRTGANGDPVVPILPGLLLWERLPLSDGTHARLVTTLPDGPEAGAAGAVLLSP